MLNQLDRPTTAQQLFWMEKISILDIIWIKIINEAMEFHTNYSWQVFVGLYFNFIFLSYFLTGGINNQQSVSPPKV